MKKAVFGLFAAALIAGTTASAQQRAACGEREKIIERLMTKYGERRQSMGLNHNNGILEIFASPETGSWTIIITMPTGRSCLVAAGEHWEAQPDDLAEVGSPV